MRLPHIPPAAAKAVNLFDDIAVPPSPTTGEKTCSGHPDVILAPPTSHKLQLTVRRNGTIDVDSVTFAGFGAGPSLPSALLTSFLQMCDSEPCASSTRRKCLGRCETLCTAHEILLAPTDLCTVMRLLAPIVMSSFFGSTTQSSICPIIVGGFCGRASCTNHLEVVDR